MSSSSSSVVVGASHFDISQLPSVLKGMSADEEALKRRKTCRFIEEAGRVMKLPRVAISTAMVFFHRFYAKHSFSDHDRFEVAVAAIVLAAKTEEAPKKLNTVIQECFKLRARSMQAGRMSQPPPTTGGSNNIGSGSSNNAADGTSPSPVSRPPTETNVTASSTQNMGEMDPKSDEFLKVKERILLLERVILHTIGFELSIDHPYKFFVEQIKKLTNKRQLKYRNVPPQSAPSAGSTKEAMYNKMTNELVQFSMSFANDSMHTSLCLQFSPQQIATACVFLACQFCGVEPVDSDWVKTLGDPDMDAMVSICVQILDLIAEKKARDSVTINKIRAQLDALKSIEEKAEAEAISMTAATAASSTATGAGGSRSPPPPRPPPPPTSNNPTKRQRVD